MQDVRMMGQKYDQVYSNVIDQFKKIEIPNIWPKNRLEAVLHVFPKSCKNLLEIGCGDGTLLYSLSDRCNKITGTEISHTRAEIAKKNLDYHSIDANIYAHDIENSKILSEEFDVIIWTDVIEHVIDVFLAMQNISKILSPKGILITTTPNIAYFRRRLQLFFGYFPSTGSLDQGFKTRNNEMYDAGHLHYFTFDVLSKLYSQFGLQTINQIGFGGLGRFNNLYPPLTSPAILDVSKKITI